MSEDTRARQAKRASTQATRKSRKDATSLAGDRFPARQRTTRVKEAAKQGDANDMRRKATMKQRTRSAILLEQQLRLPDHLRNNRQDA